MEQVASVNDNTIVVVNSVGPIIMESWVTSPNVTAVVCLPRSPCQNVLLIYGRYGAGLPDKKLV